MIEKRLTISLTIFPTSRKLPTSSTPTSLNSLNEYDACVGHVTYIFHDEDVSCLTEFGQAVAKHQRMESELNKNAISTGDLKA